MKKLTGVKNFWYYNVKEDLDLTLEDTNSLYFKTHVYENNLLWNGQPVQARLANVSEPTFDSGIACASTIKGNTENTIDKLRLFIAPYKLMSATILRIAQAIEYKEKMSNSNVNLENHYENINNIYNCPHDEIAVAIGMVLAIVATKGSAERGNRLPYLLLTQRTNVKLRNMQLDAPVVEGINYGDFCNANTAKLDKVAIRALSEERGINCKLLEEKGLLHLPKQYYLGYDAQYHQWNFFGTVVIDCTIEEIIREGCYFTKDKFESTNILAIPLQQKILSYHLSQPQIKIASLNPSGTQSIEKIEVKMWNTARASIEFALLDYHREPINTSEDKDISVKKSTKQLLWHGRNLITKCAELVNRNNRILNTGSFTLSCVLFLFTLRWIYLFLTNSINTDWRSLIITVLSTIIAFGTCLIVVSMQRAAIASGTDILFVRNQTGTNDIPEISVFHNVTLIDGNIAERERHVSFSVHKNNNNKIVTVLRKCNVFDTNNVLIDCKDSSSSIEHINWRLDPSSASHEDSLRFIVPCIENSYIRFKECNGKLEHMIDIAIRYHCFSEFENNSEEISQFIMRKISQKTNLDVNTLKFQLLLSENTCEGKSPKYVVVAFTDTAKLKYTNGNMQHTKLYPLSYELTYTSFSQNFKDDITRVACEYAIAEHVGYQMSTR